MNDLIKYFLSIGFLGIFMLSFLFYNTPEAHFWKSDYQKSIDWCKIHKPQFNLSGKESFCYTKGWRDYCQISYPEHCPNNNYTDYDRCVRKCEITNDGFNCVKEICEEGD